LLEKSLWIYKPHILDLHIQRQKKVAEHNT
jgi:hypothetical protein